MAQNKKEIASIQVWSLCRLLRLAELVDLRQKQHSRYAHQAFPEDHSTICSRWSLVYQCPPVSRSYLRGVEHGFSGKEEESI